MSIWSAVTPVTCRYRLATVSPSLLSEWVDHLGSVPGAIAGGLLMGLAEALVPSAASGWRDALAFAILFAVLLLRPSGLLGRRTVDKV